jgi:hypothetical protein
MEPKVLYRCTGSCGGVTDDASVSGCGLEGCDKFGQPLTKVLQCDACKQAADEDNQLHACSGCPSS